MLSASYGSLLVNLMIASEDQNGSGGKRMRLPMEDGLSETAGAVAAHDDAAETILRKEEIWLLIRSTCDDRRLRMKPQVWVRIESWARMK
jgi:hypothetical protein